MSVAVAALASTFGAPDKPITPEPGRKLQVFVLAGQSNMDGRADFEKLSAADRARLAAVEPRIRLAYNREPVGPLRGVNRGSAHLKEKFGAESAFGPEIFFGLGVAEASPQDRFLFIKRAVGATSLYGRWNPEWDLEKAKHMGEDKAAPLYPDLIAYVKEVLAPYAKDEYEIRAMLWVQGETDAGSTRFGPEPARQYGRNLRNLIGHVRKDLHSLELPFFLLQVVNGEVGRGMAEVSRQVPGVTLLPYASDESSPFFLQKYPVGHYDVTGMKRMGELFAEAYRKTVPLRAAPVSQR